MRQILTACVIAAISVEVIAAPKFSAVWKSPEISRLSFAGRQVAALVIAESQSLQMSGEEALVRELTARGVKGIPTYQFVPREELKSADSARPWFERRKVEGVVVLRPVAAQTEKKYTPIVWSSGYYPSFWGYYGQGWSSVYAIPAGVTTTITVETLVYDLTKDQLVWAATSDTRDPASLQNFVKDLVSEAVKEMRKMKLVS
jgi:hypothetical protein